MALLPYLGPMMVGIPSCLQMLGTLNSTAVSPTLSVCSVVVVACNNLYGGRRVVADGRHGEKRRHGRPTTVRILIRLKYAAEGQKLTNLARHPRWNWLQS